MTVFRGMASPAPSCQTREPLAAATARRSTTGAAACSTAGTTGLVAPSVLPTVVTTSSSRPRQQASSSAARGSGTQHRRSHSGSCDSDILPASPSARCSEDGTLQCGGGAEEQQAGPAHRPDGCSLQEEHRRRECQGLLGGEHAGGGGADLSSSSSTQMDLLVELPVAGVGRGLVPSESLRSLQSVNCLKILEHGMNSIQAGSKRSCSSRVSLQTGLCGSRSSSQKNVSMQHQEHNSSTDQSVPVYVMLPLDTVTAEGVLRYKNSQWFDYAMQSMRDCGVRGVAVDVWWGAVERCPGVYDWEPYKTLVEDVKALGLKLQVVLSFHACGGNVGDYASIPLPPWVLKAGDSDPDLFFTDRPRGNRRGQRNRECLSFFADDVPALEGRTPIQCYTDFMLNFAKTFDKDLGTVIDEVIVGCGPCGELRYPSYVEGNGWRFPGVGEFQCYDRRALEQLAKAAEVEGRPEWGRAGPHDAGWYNSCPEDTGFFATDDGSWDSSYGQFFLQWYSGCLLAHGRRLLEAATLAFGDKMNPSSRSSLEQMSVDGDDGRHVMDCYLDSATDTSGLGSNGSTPHSSLEENGRTHSPGSSDYGQNMDSSGRGVRRSPEARLAVTLKIAGIHWHYRSQSHAAELTAGYYNTAYNNGYAPLIQLCADFGAVLTLTCVEMCDAQHPAEARCSPEGLLYQVRKTAAEMGVSLAGENALPCFSSGGVDTTALDRIIRNTRGCDANASPSMVMSEHAPSSFSSSNRLRRGHGTFSSIGCSSTCSSSTDIVAGSELSDESEDSAALPPMRNLTFLRLNQEMIAPAYQGVWMRFMQRMHTTCESPRGYRL